MAPNKKAEIKGTMTKNAGARGSLLRSPMKNASQADAPFTPTKVNKDKTNPP